MKDFLTKYRLQIKIIAIVIWSVLAILRWVQFSETGNNLFSASLWTLLALYYTLGLLKMMREKKLAGQASLNNNTKDSAE